MLQELPLTTCCCIRDFLSVCRKSEWVPIFPQPLALISARHRAVCQALYCTPLTHTCQYNDTGVVGLTSSPDETAYREEV